MQCWQLVLGLLGSVRPPLDASCGEQKGTATVHAEVRSDNVVNDCGSVQWTSSTIQPKLSMHSADALLVHSPYLLIA